MDHRNLAPDQLMALLAWQWQMGIDEVLADQPINRYALRDAKRQANQAAQAPAKSALAPAATLASTPIMARENLPLGTAEACAQAANLAKAADSLDALFTAIDQFDGCALRRTASQTVFTDGNRASPILIIGEAPGADEDRIGKPFVGVSGQLLDRMLAAINLDRSKLLISNSIFWRPPGNRKPTDAELAICRPFVIRLIDLVQPQAILLLGGVACQSLLRSDQGITRIRGKWQQIAEVPASACLPSFHPSYLLRSPNQKKYAWRDLLIFQDKLRSLGLIAATPTSPSSKETP